MKKIKQFDLTINDLDLDNFPEKGIFIPESDYGLAEIYLSEDNGYILYEIPSFGGEPMKYGEILYDPKEVIEIIQSWT